MQQAGQDLKIKVVGVGGAGGNAVQRMADEKISGVEFLALNTDIQALGSLQNVPTFALGPVTTGGMGSGGDPDMGRKAVRESHDYVAQLIKGADLVFIAAGMGGGTGTGAAPRVIDIARKQGALTVAVVSHPFGFEGLSRLQVGAAGLKALEKKANTLITVDNNRLLSSLDRELSLEKAFKLADEVLRQGVQGITELVTLPGLVNVDFADVKSMMDGGGRSFMAIGEGKGSSAASDATRAALSNPLFDAPLCGASDVLFNIKGGRDLSLRQVNEVASTIKDTTGTETRVVFGVVQKRGWRKRVSVTLVATGLREVGEEPRCVKPIGLGEADFSMPLGDRSYPRGVAALAGMLRML